MSFILKTIRDSVISGRLWALRVIKTITLGPLKIETLQNFSNHLEFWLNGNVVYLK